MTKPRKFDVLIVDDHPVTREGIAAVLSKNDHISVFGQTGDLNTAWHMMSVTPPDIVLLDINMGAVSGIGLCQRIKAQYPGVAVMMLTAYADETHIREAIAAGADGYLLKEAEEADLVYRVLETASRFRESNVSSVTPTMRVGL
jgi:DNA-binding NarL/FixJ family response regulator